MVIVARAITRGLCASLGSVRSQSYALSSLKSRHSPLSREDCAINWAMSYPCA